jgi:hypothetical protein
VKIKLNEYPMEMEPPIPLKGVVLFIAFGTMIFIIVFCFVKRQIMRFALRSSSGPHALIGSDAPKPLATEIERRLKWVKDIMCEPQLLHAGMEDKLLAHSNSDPSHFIYRMKAVDSISLLDAEMKKFDASIFRKPGTPMKTFLLEQRQIGPLEGTKLDLVEKFCNAYEHARHDPKEFKVEDYHQFLDLLNQLINHIKIKCTAAEAATADSAFPEEQHKPSKGSSSRILTHNLQYTILAEHDGEELIAENPSQSLNPENETTFSGGASSQRMANYALAGELSLKKDASKSKNV